MMAGIRMTGSVAKNSRFPVLIWFEWPNLLNCPGYFFDSLLRTIPVMTRKTLPSLAVAALLLGAAIPAACTVHDNEFREVTAERIGRPAFMVERRIAANGMDFQLWERMHNRGEPADIYIEGDGEPTYLNRDISENPTPTNPVGLHLASRDNANNLGYISRPCQYKEYQTEDECSSKFWGPRRYSPEVLAAYNEILDEMKARWSITEFNLIGYDGGANIAAALASQRNDVASLRTVAGNLNPDEVYAKTGQVLDADSIKAPNIAPGLAKIPQHHFIGAGDEVTPPSVYHAFRQAIGESDCVHYTLVQDADHTNGWVEKWPDLLKSTVACPQETIVDPNYVPAPLPPIPEDIDHGQK